jgi:hypothetical protein
MNVIVKKILAAASVIFLGFSAVPLSAEESVDIHGFVSQGYIQSDANNFLTDSDKGSFEFNEMGLNFTYSAGNSVFIGAQLSARDLGDVGNDKVGVSWAFGDYKWRNWLGFRAGIMKSEAGLYATGRDIDTLRTCIILPQSIYDEWARDSSQGTKGAKVYGKIDTGSAGILEYGLQMSDVAIPLDSGIAVNIEKNFGGANLTRAHVDTLYLANFKWYTPIDGLLLAYWGYVTNGTEMEMNDGAFVYKNKDAKKSIFSIQYAKDNLTLTTEGSYASSRAHLFMDLGGGTIVHAINDDRTQSTNYYVSAGYRFTDWFEAGLYYSNSEKAYNGTGPGNELKDICVSTRFDITDNMIFKLESHFMDGLFGVDPGDDGKTDDKWMLYAAKVAYTF